MTTPNDTKTARPNFWMRAIEFRKHEMVRDYRTSLDNSAREGISDEDYATTMATLERMARNLGWDDSQRGNLRRGFGHGRRIPGPRGIGHRHPGMMRGAADRPVAHERAADTTTANK